MGGVVKILTAPLMLVDKKLGRGVSKIVMTALAAVNPAAALVMAGLSIGSSLLQKKPRAPGMSPEAIDRLPASIL